MRIIARRALRTFWEHHPDARPSLEAWHADVRHATWKTRSDVKRVYRNASVIANNRLVFNIKGNTCRLVVAVQYQAEIVYIRFIGSNAEYDELDAGQI